MPLVAYFRNVGALLFALLLLADYFCPQLPVVQKAAVHPSIIRIFQFSRPLMPGMSAAPGPYRKRPARADSQSRISG